MYMYEHCIYMYIIIHVDVGVAHLLYGVVDSLPESGGGDHLLLCSPRISCGE